MIERIVFVWDNYGPTHVDRAKAVLDRFSKTHEVYFVELVAKSPLYGWEPPPDDFQKISLAAENKPNFFLDLFRLLRVVFRLGRGSYFLHSYNCLFIFTTAIVLNVLGSRVYHLNDSKFDDKQRSVFGELVKAVFKWPYRGALVSGRRNAEYAIFHGISKQRVAFGYNAISVARVQAMAEAPPAPDGAPFDARHFTCVARLVPKKNHAMLLQAYRLYCDQVEVPRPLHLCGSGPLEADLRRQVAALGLTDGVVFRGWVQDDEVSRTLAHTVALLLPSTEEQFGIAVIEAQAMGVPVILSDNCGARDSVIRTGVNGFVVEPDNPHGMAFFMARLGEDEVLWRRMCGEALATAPLGDVQRFVEGVETLLSA